MSLASGERFGESFAKVSPDIPTYQFTTKLKLQIILFHFKTDRLK